MPYNRVGAMKRLHVTAARKGFDHEALRELASSFFRIPLATLSLAKLSDSQLHNFIAHLSDPGSAGDSPASSTDRSYLSNPSHPGPVPVKNAATTRQIWKIRQLATELGMDANPARLPGFIRRQTRALGLQDLTIWQASKVIEGLKNLLEHPTADTVHHSHISQETS